MIHIFLIPIAKASLMASRCVISVIVIVTFGAAILFSIGAFGIGPFALIGGIAMETEVRGLIGNFAIGFAASHISNMTSSPQAPTVTLLTSSTG